MEIELLPFSRGNITHLRAASQLAPYEDYNIILHDAIYLYISP